MVKILVIAPIPVPTPGTPVQLSNGGSNQTFVSATLIAEKSSYGANAGTIYIGTSSSMVKATGVGVIAKLSSGQTLPLTVPSGLTNQPFQLSDFYVDADTANDALKILAIIQS